MTIGAPCVLASRVPIAPARRAPSRRTLLVRQNLAQPHEAEQLEQLGGCVAQPHAAPVTTGGELEARKGVGSDRIGLDPGHVTEGHVGSAALEKGADPVAEAGEV